MLSNVNTVLFVDHIIFIVNLSAVTASNLGLLNINEDLIWQVYMHKSVQSTAVLFKEFSFLQLIGEVNEHTALLSSRAQTQQLDGNLLLDDSITVSSSDILRHLVEERMIEVWVSVRLGCGVLDQLGNRHDGNAKINGKSMKLC